MLEVGVSVGLGAEIRESLDKGNDSDLVMSGGLRESGVDLDSIRRMVEGRIEDAKSEFRLLMLDSGVMERVGRPALKTPFRTHGRTVYINCGISGHYQHEPGRVVMA